MYVLSFLVLAGMGKRQKVTNNRGKNQHSDDWSTVWSCAVILEIITRPEYCRPAWVRAGSHSSRFLTGMEVSMWPPLQVRSCTGMFVLLAW